MRAGGWVAAILLVVAGCTSDPRGSFSTSPSAAAGVTTTNPGEQALAVWRGRVAGHTVSYLATIDCARCEAKGTYNITEADGTITQAYPIGSTPPLRNPDQWSLTTVLNIAANAKGPVEIFAGSTQGRITVRVDVDPHQTGDEFTYTVSGISVT